MTDPVQKKICMVGTFSVGKTSLVRRFVLNEYSDKYLTSMGVKVDEKPVQVNGQDVALMLWDIYGEDVFQQVKMSYLRGMFGYLLVADGTRRKTYEEALKFQEKIAEETKKSAPGRKIPFILLINKCDLTDQWEIESDAETALQQRGWHVMRTSAKTGENVNEAFMRLATAMMAK
jgi:small GTP-binding protein